MVAYKAEMKAKGRRRKKTSRKKGEADGAATMPAAKRAKVEEEDGEHGMKKGTGAKKPRSQDKAAEHNDEHNS